jgi:Kef-type K+ transport system membrane component KefB
MSSSAASHVAVHQTETLLFFTLLQLVLIIGLARVAGILARKLGQAQAVGEIIAGILLGPSLLGWLAPEAFTFVFRSVPSDPMTIMSQIGLILLMFQIGMDFDFSHLSEPENRKVVGAVAAAGIALPFALGLALGCLSAPYLAGNGHAAGYVLFMATAMSITAVPILGRIMGELDITRTRLGVITITSAAINDVIGWMLLAVVTAMTLASFSPAQAGLKLLALMAYAALLWWGARPWLIRLIRRLGAEGDGLSPTLLAVLLGLIFLSAMVTYKLGVFAIFGGFMLGVLVYDQHEFVAVWKEKIERFVSVFFLPIFFTFTGLRTDIGSLSGLEAWGWCALVLLVATLGKFGGCYWAARWAGLGPTEAKAIGIMMNTRALMELVVINVGYDLGVISGQVFTMLVLMAVISTLVTAPALRLWLPQLGLGRLRAAAAGAAGAGRG